MTASKRHFRTGKLFVLLLYATVCGGCIKGDIFEFVSYEPTTDTFRYLQLDLNIVCEEPADLAHLADLWDKREQIIMHPDVFRLWSLPAILRVDATHYKAINLAHTGAADNLALETAIPLDEIKIQPGKFFLTKDNTLAYYHEVTASGKVVDEALAAWNKQMFGTLLIEPIDKELKRRADGGNSPSWADFRKQLIEEIKAEAEKRPGGVATVKVSSPPTGSSHADSSEGSPLETASLKSLRDAMAAGKMGIHRHGAELQLAMPLTPTDCRELKETIDAWTREAAKMFKADPGDYETSLKGILQTENDGGHQLVVTADLAAILNPRQLSFAGAKPNPKRTASYRDTIAGLRSRSIPIDEKLTPKQIVDDFVAKQP